MDPTELGTFDPPRDYRLEPELEGAPRRPIPPALRHGRYAAGQRRQVWGLFIAGATCLIAGFVPLIQTWGLYVLPLAWLHWIGGGLLVIALVVAAVHAVRRGPFRYVEDGLPLVVRVRALELRPTAHFNGQPATYRYFAVVEYRDPESGKLLTAETTSDDVPAPQKDGLACSYRVGGYATAVYLPGDLERSLRLYGFLGLRGGLGLVPAGGEAAPVSPAQTAGAILAIFGLFFLLGWNVYAFTAFGPAEYSHTMLIPGLGGAVLLGGAALAAIAWQGRAAARAGAAKDAAGQAVEAPSVGRVTEVMVAVVVGLGCLLMGGLTAFCWALTLNAWLDESEPRERLVRIDKMVQVTHSGLIRRYEIKYRFADDPEGKPREYASSPQEMAGFAALVGVAEERGGRFGWRWVERIRPLR